MRSVTASTVGFRSISRPFGLRSVAGVVFNLRYTTCLALTRGGFSLTPAALRALSSPHGGVAEAAVVRRRRGAYLMSEPGICGARHETETSTGRIGHYPAGRAPACGDFRGLDAQLAPPDRPLDPEKPDSMPQQRCKTPAPRRGFSLL